MKKIKSMLLFLLAFIGLSASNVYAFEHNMNKNIKKLHKKASDLNHFEDYEDDDFESFETEYFEHVEKLKKLGVPQQKATAQAQRSMTRKHGSKFTNAMGKGTKSSNQLVGVNPKYPSAAQFDIAIKRISTNIPAVLPVPLFASMHFNARYFTLINKFLPPNLTITAISTNTVGDVIITFTDSVLAVSDTVSIHCNQVPYITFLSATNTDTMRITKFRYGISNVLLQTQFDQIFSVATKSLFGKDGGQDITVSSFLDPNQFQQKVIDIDNPIDIDKETGIFVGIIAEAGFIVTLNQFVQFFKKLNRTNLS